jgi:(5-formylfuran-3-yl)methyl phosphate synthase
VTQLLVSVRSVAEAEAALRGGADWIDLKEPASGPLGAVNAKVAQKIVAYLGGRANVSAAAGELLDWPTSSARELMQVEGVTQLKLGLSEYRDRTWCDAWLAAQREIAAAGKDLVAVIYADDVAAHSPAPADVAALAVDARCRWLLIDTFDKRSGTLLECLSAMELNAIFQHVRRHGVTTAAAGRLTPAAIAELPLESVDVVAVRSAACGGDRAGMVCAEHVAALRKLLHSVGTI